MGLFEFLFGRRKLKLPEGWTETKISENTYLTHVPEEQIEAWEKERREEDDVNKLINKDGFHLISRGRSGTVYYVNSGRICEIYFEISGVEKYDLLFWFEDLKNWFYPEKVTILTDEKNKIKTEFEIWLKTKKIRTDLFDK